MRRMQNARRLPQIFAALAAAMLSACTFVSVKSVVGQAKLNGLPLIFQEDFEHGAGRWAPTDPNAWKIADENGDHVYSQFQQSKYEPPFRSPFNIALIKNLKAGTCIVDLRMEQMGAVAGENHRDMVIVFGWQDSAHFYYAHLGKTGDDASHQIHIVNGAPRVSIIKNRTQGVDWGTGWHNVRLIRNIETGAIDVYFDDMAHPALSANDKTFGAGGFGFGTFDDIGNIDDVTIYGNRE